MSQPNASNMINDLFLSPNTMEANPTSTDDMKWNVTAKNHFTTSVTPSKNVNSETIQIYGLPSDYEIVKGVTFSFTVSTYLPADNNEDGLFKYIYDAYNSNGAGSDNKCSFLTYQKVYNEDGTTTPYLEHIFCPEATLLVNTPPYFGDAGALQAAEFVITSVAPIVKIPNAELPEGTTVNTEKDSDSSYVQSGDPTSETV